MSGRQKALLWLAGIPLLVWVARQGATQIPLWLVVAGLWLPIGLALCLAWEEWKTPELHRELENASDEEHREEVGED